MACLKGKKGKESLAGDIAVKNSKCKSPFVAVPMDVTTINAGNASRHGVMMPLYNGGMLENTNLQADSLVKAGHEIAQGLKAMHDAGLHHRDLKPANIMLHNGSVRIVDFGCVKKNEELVAVNKPVGSFFKGVMTLAELEKKMNIPEADRSNIKQLRQNLEKRVVELQKSEFDDSYRNKLSDVLVAMSSYKNALAQLTVKAKTILLDQLQGSIENCFIANVRGGGSPPYLAPEAEGKAPLTDLERTDPVAANSARDAYAFGVTRCELALVLAIPTREGRSFDEFILDVKESAVKCNAQDSKLINALTEFSSAEEFESAIMDQRYLNLTSVIKAVQNGDGPATHSLALDRLLSKMLSVDPMLRPSLIEIEEFFRLLPTG